MIAIRRLIASTAIFCVAACATDGGVEDGFRFPIPQDPQLPEDGGPTCSPDAAPAWVIEGEPLTHAIACASGMTLAEAALDVLDLPDGAHFDGATGVLEWTPDLDDAAVYLATLESGTTGERVTLKIGVADAWERPDNVPIVEPERYTEELGLPVFFLFGVPPAKEYVPATLVHGGRRRSVEAKLRGDASIGYPKNNMTFSFPRDDLFQEPTRSFVGKRKINLHSGFDDNSHVRNHLSFEIWNAMDPGHVRMQSYPAVVYLDGEYWGHYTVIDHVDGELMERHGYDGDGDMFKPTHHSVDFTLDGKATPHDGWEKTEGVPDAWHDLDALVTFVHAASDPAFRDGLDEVVDLRDYQDWWILVTLIFGNDSAAKNNYHYHGAGPFRFVPWDYNASFGQNWRTVRRPATAGDEDIVRRNRMFQRMLADPGMSAAMRARYGTMLRERVPKATVLAWFDAYVREIEASALRDERRWGGEYRTYAGWSDRTDFTTWDQEVAYIRAWIDERWDLQESRYAP